MPYCPKCYTEKPDKEFTRTSAICKNCCKNYKLKSKYGINLKYYNKMYVQQKGCCAICGKHEDSFNVSLAVDHDHNTGKVRKLLCFNCNAALGLLKEDENIVASLLSYIKEHND